MVYYFFNIELNKIKIYLRVILNCIPIRASLFSVYEFLFYLTSGLYYITLHV